MLLSTQAATMPSVTISNYRPLTKVKLRYEAFVARMSESSNIAFGTGTTAGHPQLAGLALVDRALPRLVARRRPDHAVRRRRP